MSHLKAYGELILELICLHLLVFKTVELVSLY